MRTEPAPKALVSLADFARAAATKRRLPSEAKVRAAEHVAALSRPPVPAATRINGPSAQITDFKDYVAKRLAAGTHTGVQAAGAGVKAAAQNADMPWLPGL